MRKKVILVIDDDEMNLQIAKMILEKKLPCTVLSADNGVEGIDILKSRRVNLVLLDVLMPDFDGIETLQEIRGDDQIKGVPVMMLTASTDKETIQKAALLGVRDYIKKPFMPADLVARVQKKLAEDHSEEILLLGDDEPILQDMKRIIEENSPHEALIAASFDTAEKFLREQDFDLIIACADMKFIDGFRILALLAGDDKFKTIPFALTTPDKLGELFDKINQPAVEEPPIVEEIWTKPSEEPLAQVETPVEEPAQVEQPAVEEVAAVVTRSEKKKIAKVVTNLIGYDLDVRI